MSGLFNSLIIICALLIAIECQVDPKQIKIVEYINENDGLGNYNFKFRTSDGTERKESSEFVESDSPDKDPVYIVRGTYSYNLPGDQYKFVVEYVADDKGYRYTSKRVRIIPKRIGAAALQSLQGG